MKLVLLLLTSGVALAHTFGYSTATLQLNGDQAAYELRVPLHDIASLPGNPDPLITGQRLVAQFHLYSQQHEAQRSSVVCTLASNELICRTQFQFAAPPSLIHATCRIAELMAQGHIHHLLVHRGTETANAFFDRGFTDADLVFQPQTLALNWHAIRWLDPFAWLGVFGAAFLVRSRRGLVLLAGALSFSMVAGVLAPTIPVPAPMRLVGALCLSYSLLERILQPSADRGWIGILLFGFALGQSLNVTGGAAAAIVLLAVMQAACLAITGVVSLQMQSEWQRRLAALPLLTTAAYAIQTAVW